ncbi:response regulator [Saccharibacillus kuerlensis]|uniref:DNA-binding response regulator n=1 Tax=Saccharibacillus kuerlensis TaxID=459527 RepID=A0ABQ2L6Z6_9BACL|nr:response regulator [Saccharibacillus kuerlensis]GGO05480.1 hypothetical protein GCM10010969_31900 [Saccharibacillus kuerlensis]
MREPLYKVLIADDEPIIREGLRESVNWTELGMEVVGEAEDGEEALELALELEIQLALVDMNMPFVNGIELMKKLRERLPDCRFIIITGHDEFAYAQEGIRLGVEDYILKPVNSEHLHQVLAKVKENLDSQFKQHEYLKLASEQIQKNIPLLKARFGQEWIDGLLSPEEIEDRLKFLELPTDNLIQLCAVRWPEIDAAQPGIRESDRQLYLFAVENIVSELAEGRRSMLFRDTSELILLLLWDEAEEGITSQIERNVRQFLKIAVNAHIEKISEGWGCLPDIYKKCRESIYRETQLSPLVRRARQHIQDYYSDPDLTLETFARSLQVSPVYLSRVLKRELGDSFVALLTHMRIRKAIQLLNATDLSIYEIAEQTGYDSQHYFSTAFKKVMGVSPNQYRKGAAFSDRPAGV